MDSLGPQYIKDRWGISLARAHHKTAGFLSRWEEGAGRGAGRGQGGGREGAAICWVHGVQGRVQGGGSGCRDVRGAGRCREVQEGAGRCREVVRGAGR